MRDTNAVFQFGIGTALYAWGRARDDHKVGHIGWDLLRGQIVCQTITQAIKSAVTKPRPDKSDLRSFPSGHASGVFTTVSILHQHYGWKVGAPGYVIASYVALSRLPSNRHYLDRRVALLSEDGADVTTIDGQDLAPVISVHRLVDHAVIDGFRVTHGIGEPAGYAGGIDVDLGSKTGGYATIRCNIVEHNYSVGGPGGIYSLRQSIVEDNVIQYNNREQVAKGISAMEVSGTIERNVVRNNGLAGDLYTVLVWNTDTFAWNLVVNDRGVNVAFRNGGSIHNNTIVVESSKGEWTVSLSGSIPFDFNNNLIVHDTAGRLVCGGNGSYTIRCNDVWGIGPSYIGDCEGLEEIDGNFSADPLFCDGSHGDFGITAASPCAPGNAPPGCGLIGALDVGCGQLAIDGTAPAEDWPLITIAPNPFWFETELTVRGVRPGNIVEIINASGRVIEALAPAASDEARWRPSPELRSGVYFARVRGMEVRPARFVVIR